MLQPSSAFLSYGVFRLLPPSRRCGQWLAFAAFFCLAVPVVYVLPYTIQVVYLFVAIARGNRIMC